MKPDRAIQLLQQDLDDPGSVDYNDRAKAQELSIEALKWIYQWRGVNSSLANIRLPGETSEVE